MKVDGEFGGELEDGVVGWVNWKCKLGSGDGGVDVLCTRGRAACLSDSSVGRARASGAAMAARAMLIVFMLDRV